MTLAEFLKKLSTDPNSIEFNDTISVIDANYNYSPTAFENGTQKNTVGQNEGSCKILAFGKLNNLDKEQTLHCFGQYYREEVLNDPDGESHQNIRQFMLTGWEGVNFENQALQVSGTC